MSFSSSDSSAKHRLFLLDALSYPPLSLGQNSLEQNAPAAAPLSQLEDYRETCSLPDTPRPLAEWHRPRAKSYGEALAPETLELIQDFESRIAVLESRHTSISMELEESRDALEKERSFRHSSDRFSTLLHTRFSVDGTESDQSDADYERGLREELQETVKKIRAQYAVVSRALRDKEDECSAMSKELEAERAARQDLEQETARLSLQNETLFEHNVLLAGRDAALQESISSLVERSHVEQWMRCVLQAELQGRAEKDGISARNPEPDWDLPQIEQQDDRQLQDELVSTRDELEFAKNRLSITELQVSALQHQLSQSIDFSTQALHAERDLRADLESRAQAITAENLELKRRLGNLLDAFPDGHAPNAWIKRSHATSHKAGGLLGHPALEMSSSSSESMSSEGDLPPQSTDILRATLSKHSKHLSWSVLKLKANSSIFIDRSTDLVS